MANRIIDLSHTIEDGLITYKGLPAPIICDYLSRKEAQNYYDDGSEFQISKIEMVSNTGTYLDCPFHRFADGHDLAALEIDSCAELEGIVIRADHREVIQINQTHFEGYNLHGKAVLIHTGWDEHWNSDKYYENHPFITAGAANYLLANGVKLVGIDSHNIDDTHGTNRPVHSILLSNKVLIVEHLCNLASLPHSGFYFSAVPPKFKGVGTFPVRALARLY